MLVPESVLNGYSSCGFVMIGANQQQVHSDLAQLRARAAQVWSEGALRLVFERSRDAILLLDDGVFIDCNQAAVDMLRANGKDELLSLSPSDLSPAIQPDGTPSSIKSQQMNAVALERGSHRFEWLAKRRNGSEFTSLEKPGKTFNQTSPKSITFVPSRGPKLPWQSM